jgi:hypothetical protein
VTCKSIDLKIDINSPYLVSTTKPRNTLETERNKVTTRAKSKYSLPITWWSTKTADTRIPSKPRADAKIKA